MSDEASTPSQPAAQWEELQDGVRKCVTVEAPSPKVYPKLGEEVVVHYTGTLPGSTEPFDCSRKRDQPFTFELGAGAVITGWDAAFEKLAIGERALLEIESEWAYGKAGHPPAIPPDATLHFDVELISSGPKKKELNMMRPEEKLEEALLQKQKGLDVYAKKDWAEARKAFAEAIFYCDATFYSRESKAMPEAVGNIYLSAHLNASQCALNTKDWPAACAYATRAIKCVPDSVKGLYRRGVARTRMGLLEEAREDLKTANALDPTNRAVRHAWAALKKEFADQSTQQKKAFGGTFDRASLFKDKPSNAAEPSKTENPYAFIRVRATPRTGETSADEAFSGTIVVRVFADACPRTAKNFLALCKGGKKGRDLSSSLHYKGTPIHRIAKDFMIQGGDVHRRDGSSGESIYGRTFADEHFKLKFDKPGRLAMANRGKDSNHSQFFITCASATHCNDSYVVFGEVVAGLDLVTRVASLNANDKDAPADYAVEIADCGALAKEQAEAALAAEADAAAVASAAAGAPLAEVA